MSRRTQELQDTIANLSLALETQRVRANNAAWTLKELGWEERVTHRTSPGREYDHSTFVPPKGFRHFTQDELEQREETTRKQERDNTLKTVIEALELPGYSSQGPYLTHSDAYAIAIGTSARTTPAPKSNEERFWDDLQTALEVRAERKRDSERSATTARVTNLGKRGYEYAGVVHRGGVLPGYGSLFSPGAFDFGSSWHGDFGPRTNAAQSKIREQFDNLPKATPEKAPAKKKPKKSGK